MSPPETVSRRFRCRAFSLVEVTLALGILTFALLSLLGLLPIGLVAMRESTQQTACSHIIQGIASDLAAMSQTNLPGYLAERRFYDSDGILLAAQEEGKAIFVADLEARLPDYPGSGNLADPGNQVSRIVVTVSRAMGSAGTSDRPIVRTSLSLTDLKQ